MRLQVFLPFSEWSGDWVLEKVCFCSVVSYSLWPLGCNPPGSSVDRLSQARILEWVSISLEMGFLSRGSSRPRDQTHVSGVSCIDRQVLYCWTTEKPYKGFSHRLNPVPFIAFHIMWNTPFTYSTNNASGEKEIAVTGNKEKVVVIIQPWPSKIGVGISRRKYVA